MKQLHRLLWFVERRKRHMNSAKMLNCPECPCTYQSHIWKMTFRQGHITTQILEHISRQAELQIWQEISLPTKRQIWDQSMNLVEWWLKFSPDAPRIT